MSVLPINPQDYPETNMHQIIDDRSIRGVFMAFNGSEPNHCLYVQPHPNELRQGSEGSWELREALRKHLRKRVSSLLRCGCIVLFVPVDEAITVLKELDAKDVEGSTPPVVSISPDANVRRIVIQEDIDYRETN